MCIRDSSRGEGGRLELQGRVHERPGNGRRVVAGTGRAPDTCLLYTSDAADERSSVDLGGRRIIKKKTKRR